MKMRLEKPNSLVYTICSYAHVKYNTALQFGDADGHILAFCSRFPRVSKFIFSAEITSAKFLYA